MKVEESSNAATTTAALTSSPTTTAAANTAETSATAAPTPAETSTTANLPTVLTVTTTAKSGVNGMRAEGFASTVLNMILFLSFASGLMVAFL